MSRQKRKIGITIGDLDHLWSNGIHQNAIILGEALEKAGYKVFYIGRGDKATTHPDLEGRLIHSKQCTFEKGLDVVIGVSWGAPPAWRELGRKKNTKYVSIQYGNKFESYQEEFVGLRETNSPLCLSMAGQDQVWISPHFAQNLGWYEAIAPSVETKVCPYVWNERFFMERCETFKDRRDPFFNDEVDMRKISIHEPNLSQTKCLVTPLAITGLFKRAHPDLITDCYVLNASQLNENERYIDYITALGLKDVISSDSRRSTPFMTTQRYTGIPVFHQRNCDLNYIYLEFLHLGYPIVHNSDAMKGVGYYYEKDNVTQGAEQLYMASSTHRDNIKEYKEKAKETVWKYHSDNPANIEGYAKLIEELF